MATKLYPLIAREGWGRLVSFAAVALVLYFTLGFLAALPAVVFLAFRIYQFRDPTRSPPSLPLAVVSPIHGQISAIEETTDPWLKRASIAVSIRGGLLDIRSLYSPTEGKIVDQWRTQAVENNENAIAYWIQTDEMDDVVLEIQPRGVHGPMTFRYNPGERLGQGRRVGFVNRGCNAKVYLPATSIVNVQVGAKVKASADILATFVHLTAMAKTEEQAKS